MRCSLPCTKWHLTNRLETNAASVRAAQPAGR
jgi:hypothetical protein